jgi:amidohydrolase
MNELIEFRQLLHSHPELAHNEVVTSGLVQKFLEACKPDDMITEIGGHGVAAVFKGADTGSNVLVRCELDALPIPETINLPYGSTTDGIAHKCGHDGHMSIVAGVAERLYKQRPKSGAAILLFQPAEETGEGAEKVIKDPKFKQIKPDYAFALHNLPGYPLGRVIISENTFAAASTGLIINLHGQTSHAAEPESGKSPAMAVSQLISSLSSLPQFKTSLHQSAQVTVIHAKLGEVAFGTSPGEGCVMATLRSYSQEVMDELIEEAKILAKGIAGAYELESDISCTQVFPSTVNSRDATTIIKNASAELEMNTHELDLPFAWSEDFGHFTAMCKAALFGLGAGEDHPALHHPDYDFPEQLLEPGINIFTKIIRNLLG